MDDRIYRQFSETVALLRRLADRIDPTLSPARQSSTSQRELVTVDR
jgi:hypothetical protein